MAAGKPSNRARFLADRWRVIVMRERLRVWVLVLVVVAGAAAVAYLGFRTRGLDDAVAAEQCRHLYSLAQSPAESTVVDRHRPTSGGESPGGRTTCGERRSRGDVR
jgi:hypothetical protein